MKREMRPLIGGIAGALLAILGPVGLAVGGFSLPVGRYSHPIPFRAQVGLFAYTEGRIEAQANWWRQVPVSHCYWDEGSESEQCDTQMADEQLSITVAQSDGAYQQGGATANGQVNPVTRPDAEPNSTTTAGPGKHFNAYYSYCGPDDCFDRFIWLEPNTEHEFSFEADPRLRHATFRGNIQGVEISIDWVADGPMGTGGTFHHGRVVEPRPGFFALVHSDNTLGRPARASATLEGFAPDLGPSDWGQVYYGATAHADSRGEAPVRVPRNGG